MSTYEVLVYRNGELIASGKDAELLRAASTAIVETRRIEGEVSATALDQADDAKAA